jgi:hypothetical protein
MGRCQGGGVRCGGENRWWNCSPAGLSTILKVYAVPGPTPCPWRGVSCVPAAECRTPSGFGQGAGRTPEGWKAGT